MTEDEKEFISYLIAKVWWQRNGLMKEGLFVREAMELADKYGLEIDEDIRTRAKELSRFQGLPYS